MIKGKKGIFQKEIELKFEKHLFKIKYKDEKLLESDF